MEDPVGSAQREEHICLQLCSYLGVKLLVLGWAKIVIISFFVDVKIKGYSREVGTRTVVFSRRDLSRT